MPGICLKWKNWQCNVKHNRLQVKKVVVFLQCGAFSRDSLDKKSKSPLFAGLGWGGGGGGAWLQMTGALTALKRLILHELNNHLFEGFFAHLCCKCNFYS